MSKSVGTPAETAVVNYLRTHGFAHAERRALTGALDKGDVSGCIGICWEVKAGNAAMNASDGQVERWLEETETERVNARADIGVLVMKRKGVSGTRAGEWWAVMDGGVFADLVYEPEPGATPFSRTIGAPVRAHLSTVVELLRDSGYGSPR
jgi:hypothetical protein